MYLTVLGAGQMEINSTWHVSSLTCPPHASGRERVDLQPCNTISQFLRAWYWRNSLEWGWRVKKFWLRSWQWLYIESSGTVSPAISKPPTVALYYKTTNFTPRLPSAQVACVFTVSFVWYVSAKCWLPVPPTLPTSKEWCYAGQRACRASSGILLLPLMLFTFNCITITIKLLQTISWPKNHSTTHMWNWVMNHDFLMTTGAINPHFWHGWCCLVEVQGTSNWTDEEVVFITPTFDQHTHRTFLHGVHLIKQKH